MGAPKKTFFCIDAHTCGNPVRLVAGGAPLLKGRTMGEKRQYFQEHYDWIRRGLMFEPRGHDMMSGGMLYPPTNPEHDAGVLFIETSGCLPMCGHGTIGLVTIAVEEGLITPPKTDGGPSDWGAPQHLTLETPAGLVKVRYRQEGRKVTSVRLTNVPSFLMAERLEVACPELGTLAVDVSYGGNFYAIINEQANYQGLDAYPAESLIRWSRAIRAQLNEQHPFIHPEDPSIQGLSHVMWTGAPTRPEATARNAVFYGDKALDRSPCGTGTSARMAQWFAQGKLAQGDTFVHESIINSRFTGRIEDVVTVGEYSAIVPSIEGWAIVTGYNHIIIDEDDPYALGFQVL